MTVRTFATFMSWSARPTASRDVCMTSPGDGHRRLSGARSSRRLRHDVAVGVHRGDEELAGFAANRHHDSSAVSAGRQARATDVYRCGQRVEAEKFIGAGGSRRNEPVIVGRVLDQFDQCRGGTGLPVSANLLRLNRTDLLRFKRWRRVICRKGGRTTGRQQEGQPQKS